MAVMHWAFMDLGDDHATANARLQAVIRATCEACAKPTAGLPHGSIDVEWYGTHFCGLYGTSPISDRATLYREAEVGDVLITNHPRSPMHSMVVVSKSSARGRRFVYVRGFNNLGTLGTGARAQYDGFDRDIDRGRYWHAAGRFGNDRPGNCLYRIRYDCFKQRAAVVRNNCKSIGSSWAYTG
jgi:hypothetical protein